MILQLPGPTDIRGQTDDSGPGVLMSDAVWEEWPLQWRWRATEQGGGRDHAQPRTEQAFQVDLVEVTCPPGSRWAVLPRLTLLHEPVL